MCCCWWYKIQFLIFADDCSLLASGLDPNETAKVLNRDLEKISSWANLWKVTFNAGKTKELVFSNKVLNNSPPLVFNNTFIEKKTFHRHLGVYLTPTLDWTHQINDVCLKANSKLSVLRSVKMLKKGDFGPPLQNNSSICYWLCFACLWQYFKTNLFN